MDRSNAFRSPEENGPRKWAVIAMVGVVLAVLAWAAYALFSDVDGVKIKAAPPTVVDMLPPPPPPPPPPPEMKEPEPLEQPNDSPQPTPDQPAPTPMQIDGPAQAGSDAYGMQAGSGGGMGAPATTGACVGPNCGVAGTDRFWGRNISRSLEAHIEKSRAVNVEAFVSEYEIWVSGSGRLTRARLVKSSGNDRLDATVLDLLQSAPGLKPPPPTLAMPQRVKVGRKRI